MKIKTFFGLNRLGGELAVKEALVQNLNLLNAPVCYFHI